MTHQRLRRCVAPAVLAVVLLAGCGTGSGGRPPTGPRAPAALVWPQSMCAPAQGDRFTTTTVSPDTAIRAEPATGQPRNTAQQAYARYLALYHHPTRAEQPHLQVRYGVLTDGETGPASGDGLIPFYRRTRAWVISLCDSPRPAAAAVPMGGRHRPPLPPDGGFFTVELADDAHLQLLTGWYLTAKSSNGLGGLGVSADNPTPRSTPFVSVAWRQVARQGQRELLRYTPLPCHTLDHVDIGGDTRDTVSVILSGGPGATCPAPSAVQPYAEVTVSVATLRHGPLGPRPYQPVSSR